MARDGSGSSSGSRTETVKAHLWVFKYGGPNPLNSLNPLLNSLNSLNFLNSLNPLNSLTLTPKAHPCSCAALQILVGV